MTLSQGLWSDSSLLVSAGLSVLVVIGTAFAVRGISSRGLTARNALVVPVTAVLAQLLYVSFVAPAVWYWLFLGISLVAGAAAAFGVSLRRREARYGLVSVALMAAGLSLAALRSEVEFEWVLLLGGVLGGVAFAVGYLLSSGERRASAFRSVVGG